MSEQGGVCGERQPMPTSSLCTQTYQHVHPYTHVHATHVHMHPHRTKDCQSLLESNWLPQCLSYLQNSMLGTALSLLLPPACTDLGSLSQQWEMYVWHLKSKSCLSVLTAGVSIEIRCWKKQTSKLPWDIFLSRGNDFMAKAGLYQMAVSRDRQLPLFWSLVISYMLHPEPTLIYYVLIAPTQGRMQMCSTEPSFGRVPECSFSPPTETPSMWWCRGRG